jgi:hypothetical protein
MAQGAGAIINAEIGTKTLRLVPCALSLIFEHNLGNPNNDIAPLWGEPIKQRAGKPMLPYAGDS